MATMARKREKLEGEEPAGKRRQVDSEMAPGTPVFGADPREKVDLTALLVEKVMKQLDMDLLAENVAPELSTRVFTSISVEDLGEKVIELLAVKLLENSGLLETLSARLLEKFLPLR